MSSAFHTRLAKIATEMETVLAQVLPEPAGPQKRVMEAMGYAALGGGKRLRPFLLIETARMMGYESPGVWQTAAALECVHVYSLIHDDLPCMDDDDLRRGRPTVHKAYDEALAVLAGDALLTLAFEILAQETVHPDAKIRLKLISDLAASSGTHGMIGGQVIDIYAGQNEQDEALITQLQALKTGALMHYAVIAGGGWQGQVKVIYVILVHLQTLLAWPFKFVTIFWMLKATELRWASARARIQVLVKPHLSPFTGLQGPKPKLKSWV